MSSPNELYLMSLLRLTMVAMAVCSVALIQSSNLVTNPTLVIVRMTNIKPLPLLDLRFEETFIKSLQVYAAPKAANDTEETPIPPITPSIVTYAIIKDQVILPLIQGFLWSGLVLLTKPFLVMVVRHGQRLGAGLVGFIGIRRLLRPA